MVSLSLSMFMSQTNMTALCQEFGVSLRSQYALKIEIVCLFTKSSIRSYMQGSNHSVCSTAFYQLIEEPTCILNDR